MKHLPIRILFAILLASLMIPAFAAERTFTLEELAVYNGKDGQPAYVAVEGVVYDVSGSARWKDGRHNGYEAGADLTAGILGRSPHGTIVLGRMPIVGTLSGYVPTENTQRSTGNLYAILGILSVVLAIIITSPYLIRSLNTKFFHIKGSGYTKTLKTLRTIHKPAGAILLIIALIHGYLALGTFRIHSGQLVWLAFFATAILGLLFFLKRKPALLKAHRTAALVAVILIVVHLVFPNILGFLS